MGTIKRFEDIIAWQEARQLAAIVYAITAQGAFSRDFGLRDQIRRAAVSVGSNIAEGFERSGNKEFAHFLWIAKGSAGEVISQLYTALDVGYITESQLAELAELSRHCSYLIYKLIQTLKTSSVPGERYKTPRVRTQTETPQTSQTSQTSQTPQTSQTSQTSQTPQTSP